MEDDRRRAPRFRVWFPMRFDGSDTDTPQAVSRNISNMGVLMATARQLEHGSTVTLLFRVSLEDPTEHKVPGRIVRCEPNAEDPHGLWPYMVAVEFDEAAPSLEPLLEEAAGNSPTL